MYSFPLLAAALAATASPLALARPAAPAAALDFGSCTDPSISFKVHPDRVGDGNTFQPNDLVNFNHGSALGPDPITKFVCESDVPCLPVGSPVC